MVRGTSSHSRFATVRSNPKQRVTVTAGPDERRSDDQSGRSFSPCIANGAERSKFEQLKADSDYLREPLATELENELPNFTDGAVQLLKFHGSYQQDNRDNRQKGQAFFMLNRSLLIKRAPSAARAQPKHDRDRRSQVQHRIQIQPLTPLEPASGDG